MQETLPGLLGRAATPALPRPAVVQFMVLDATGCDLAYRLSERGVEVAPGIADDVQLTLAFTAADLAAFSAHRLDVARAVRTQRLKIYGDASLLDWMARRLESAAREVVR